jgi:hypothetical protein
MKKISTKTVVLMIAMIAAITACTKKEDVLPSAAKPSFMQLNVLKADTPYLRLDTPYRSVVVIPTNPLVVSKTDTPYILGK